MLPSIVRLAGCVAGLTVVGAGFAGAQDCPRGDLDKAYCDRNGDLVADAPTDPKQLVNPSTLIFAYTPVEDPALYTKVWDGFLKHAGEGHRQEGRVLPGAVERGGDRGDALRPPAHRRRQHRPDSDRGELRGLRAVRHHGHPGRHLRLRDGNHRAGRQPDQDAGRSQGQEGRVHRADLELRLQGAVGDPRSPNSISRPKRDFTPVFSGKHDNSVLGVANKDYDAAAIANEVMFRMFERKVVDKAKIRTIYKSETFPTTSYGIAHNLDPALAAKIKEAFFTFPWEGSALKAEFKTEDRFVPITYQKDWSVIRKIDAATGVKYTCK